MDQETPKVAPDILYNLRLAAKEAVDCQSACNLSAVAISFGRNMHYIFTAAVQLQKGTDWWNKHPICYLFSTQIAHLTGTNPIGCHDHKAWDAAYAYCMKLGAGEDVPMDYTEFKHVG